jgi:hypothetical protein
LAASDLADASASAIDGHTLVTAPIGVGDGCAGVAVDPATDTV